MYLYFKCITYAIIEFDFQYHYNISLKQIFSVYVSHSQFERRQK